MAKPLLRTLIGLSVSASPPPGKETGRHGIAESAFPSPRFPPEMPLPSQKHSNATQQSGRSSKPSLPSPPGARTPSSPYPSPNHPLSLHELTFWRIRNKWGPPAFSACPLVPHKCLFQASMGQKEVLLRRELDGAESAFWNTGGECCFSCFISTDMSTVV